MERVLVIGARRSRQGIGEFVARWFHHWGSEVCAVVGTTARSAEEARRALAERYGIACRGYASLEAALREEKPDIVAICSPFPRHAEHLERAAAAGSHCLCEKPLWWGETAHRAARTKELVEAFSRKGLYLALVVEWPYTLPSYFRLFPHLEGESVGTFQMMMSPISSGTEMVLDAAPHPLSMLQKLVGPGEVRSPRAVFGGGSLERLELTFDYCHPAGTTRVQCSFSRCLDPPRPASYGVNGHEAQRKVGLPSYDLSLAAEGREVAMEDPLGLLVKDFIAKLREGRAPDHAAIASGMAGLESLTTAAREGLADWMNGRRKEESLRATRREGEAAPIAAETRRMHE